MTKRSVTNALRMVAARAAAVLMLAPCCGVGHAGEPQPTAELLMIRAHQARAEWRDFPGFTAEITAATDGRTVSGGLRVSADGTLTLSLRQELPEGFDWLHPRLQSLISHRLPPERERTFDVAFADDVQTHPLGRLIRLNGDRLHSVYRIREDVITEVHRTMGPKRFTINVLETTRNAEGKQLPGCYSLSWWDVKSGALTEAEVVRNAWVRVKRWDLPVRILSVRTANDEQREVREVRFTNHRLLDAK